MGRFQSTSPGGHLLPPKSISSISKVPILLSTSSSRPWASSNSARNLGFSRGFRVDFIWKKSQGQYEIKPTKIFFRRKHVALFSFLDKTDTKSGWRPTIFYVDFHRSHHPQNPDRSLPSQIWKTICGTCASSQSNAVKPPNSRSSMIFSMFQMFHSMDWFRGQNKGNPNLNGKIYGL